MHAFGTMYHVTDARLAAGDTLLPYTLLLPGGPPRGPWHEGRHAWRAGRVWMSTVRRHDLETHGRFSYIVEPADDIQFLGADRDPILDALGTAQFHASRATVVRKLRRR